MGESGAVDRRRGHASTQLPSVKVVFRVSVQSMVLSEDAPPTMRSHAAKSNDRVTFKSDTHEQDTFGDAGVLTRATLDHRLRTAYCL